MLLGFQGKGHALFEQNWTVLLLLIHECKVLHLCSAVASLVVKNVTVFHFICLINIGVHILAPV